MLALVHCHVRSQLFFNLFVVACRSVLSKSPGLLTLLVEVQLKCSFVCRSGRYWSSGGMKVQENGFMCNTQMVAALLPSVRMFLCLPYGPMQTTACGCREMGESHQHHSLCVVCASKS